MPSAFLVFSACTMFCVSHAARSKKSTSPRVIISPYCIHSHAREMPFFAGVCVCLSLLI